MADGVLPTLVRRPVVGIVLRCIRVDSCNTHFLSCQFVYDADTILCLDPDPQKGEDLSSAIYPGPQ